MLLQIKQIKMKEKVKFNVKEMEVKQCINWIEEIFANNPLGTTEEIASKEVLHKLRTLFSLSDEKIVKQQKVIDFVLDGTKISGKDKTELVRLLLE